MVWSVPVRDVDEAAPGRFGLTSGGARKSLGARDLSESLTIGASCRSEDSSEAALNIAGIPVSPFRRRSWLPRHSELLILDQQFTYPLLQAPQLLLPLCF